MPGETREPSTPGPDPQPAGGEPDPASDSVSRKSLPPIPAEPSFRLNRPNINGPPPQAWHGLPPEVRGQLLGKMLDNSDRAEERKFQFAVSVSKRKRERALVGGFAATAGLGLCGYLASHGMNAEVTAVVVFLSTIIGVAIGNRIGP